MAILLTDTTFLLKLCVFFGRFSLYESTRFVAVRGLNVGFCGQNSTNFWCHDFVFAAEWRIILRLKFDRFCDCLPYEKDHDFAALQKSTSFFIEQRCAAFRPVGCWAKPGMRGENLGCEALLLSLVGVRSRAHTFFLTSAHPFSHERKAFFSR